MSEREDYLDDLLNSVIQNSGKNDIEQAQEKKTDEADVTDLLDSMTGDSELAEISDLLKQSDIDHVSPDDMLALLENAEKGNEQQTESHENEFEDGLFDFFANEQEEPADYNLPEESMPIGNNQTPEDFLSIGNDRMPEDFLSFGNDQMPEQSGNMESADQVHNEFDQILTATETKAEEKARKKKEKQEAKEREKQERARAKEEQNRAKQEAKKKKKTEERASGGSEVENGGKKKGFFGRMMDSLFEEAPEPEENQQGTDSSEGNQEGLDAFGNEAAVPKKGKKKGKKAKAEKNKKGDTEQGAEDSEEGDQKNKKDKKEKKVKKVKKQKPEKAQEKKEQGPKLPKKKVISIVLVCLTLLAIVVIASFAIPSYWNRQTARKAFYQADYETVYNMLNNERLSDSEKIMYEQSVLILYMENKMDAYRLNMALGQEKEAVNELFGAVAFYQDNLEYAQEYGALEEMQKIYSEMLEILNDIYHVSESRAIEITQLETLDYNKELYYLLYGIEFETPDTVGVQSAQDIDENAAMEEKDIREDLLPEEEPMPESVFVSNEDEISESVENTDENTAADFMDEPEDSEGSLQENDTPESVDQESGGQEAEVQENREQEPADTGENVLFSGTVENGTVVVQ